MKKKQITKEQFFADVRKEINNIKKYATKKQINNLDITMFDPDSPRRCIYGQMTGDCRNTKAKNLIYNCCIRLVHNDEKPKNWRIIKKNINGKIIEFTKKQFNTTRSELFYTRIEYFSALEAYIIQDKNKNKEIIEYLKDERKDLVL